MTAEQIKGLGPAFTDFLGSLLDCFLGKATFKHFGAYCRGLHSDLPRKSVEPIALAGGGDAVRTLQELLTHLDLVPPNAQESGRRGRTTSAVVLAAPLAGRVPRRW